MIVGIPIFPKSLTLYYTSFGWRNVFPENSIWNTAVSLPCVCLSSSSWLWRLINFRLFYSDDCRSQPCEEKFWPDDCRSWPREEKINNHGYWGKHAHIPNNDYWGICLFHVMWTNFCFAIILMWYTRNIYIFFVHQLNIAHER